MDDGVVQKLFNSVRGGLTVYQFDPEGAYCYYYAHLDRYADGLREGQTLRKGERDRLRRHDRQRPARTRRTCTSRSSSSGPEKQWWKGAALNPFPVWAEPRGVKPAE